MLAHWARDRSRGERLPVETVVHLQTRRTAELYGFRDRGLLAPGHLADVNVIDHDALALDPPEMVYDLPGSGKRLIQRARGYVATVKSGVVVREHDEATGARPGRLLRGPQPQPAARRPESARAGGPQHVGEPPDAQRGDPLPVRLEDVAHRALGPAEVDVDVDRHGGAVDLQRAGIGPEVLEDEGALGVVAEDVLVPAAAVAVHVEDRVGREQARAAARGPAR